MYDVVVLDCDLSGIEPDPLHRTTNPTEHPPVPDVTNDQKTQGT